jgi:hypothetical protein
MKQMISKTTKGTSHAFKEWSSKQSTPKNKLAENPKVVPASAQPAPEPDRA